MGVCTQKGLWDLGPFLCSDSSLNGVTCSCYHVLPGHRTKATVGQKSYQLFRTCSTVPTNHELEAPNCEPK